MDATSFIGQGRNITVEAVRQLKIEMKPLTIKSVGVREYSAEDRRLNLSFKELDNTHSLNKTNAKTLADAFGKETDAWEGHRIMFVIVKTNLEGKDGLQIKVVE